MNKTQCAATAQHRRPRSLFNAVDWTPHCHCPACGRADPQTYDTKPIDTDTHTRKRYHRCTCKAIFASLEVIRADTTP
jgi:hypothetical protein